MSDLPQNKISAGRTLSVSPQFTSKYLADLSERVQYDPDWAYADDLSSEMAMSFPDIVQELIARRHADLAIINLDRSGEELRLATNLLKSPGRIPAGTLKQACETVLRHSKDAHLRGAAEDVLLQMRVLV
jgi:hypothetical protein